MREKMKSFGKILCRAREKKQLTQKDLGYILGKSQQAIDNWEKNKREPCLEDFLKLVIILGIDFETLKKTVKAVEFDLNKSVKDRWVEQGNI
jgi:transcriptional regulator with XRE-family HTH domain